MTKELIERLRGTDSDALTCVDRLRLYEHDPKTFEFTTDDAEEVLAIIDETADALEGRVTVKPLEWHFDLKRKCYEADTPIAKAYSVKELAGSDSPYFETSGGGSWTLLYEGDDLPSAKAAAQADYERRIRSALSAPAQRVEEGEVCGTCHGSGNESPKQVCRDCDSSVADIVPVGCTGRSLAFSEGVLHVSKDGSGYIAIGEDEFTLEDDRCEGPDGPQGSVHWITRFPPGELETLRDFLNGVPLAASPAPAPHAGVDGEIAHRLAVAKRDADDVSNSIIAGKRISRSRVEDLRNHVRYLVSALEVRT